MCGAKSDLFAISHYLDPFFRGVVLEELGLMNDVKEKIKERWTVLHEPNNNHEPAETPTFSPTIEDPTERLLAARKKKTPSQAVELSEIEKEFLIFEDEPGVEKSVDRCAWYRERKRKLPLLFKIAQELFAIPASSASSERVFSSSGLVSL